MIAELIMYLKKVKVILLFVISICFVSCQLSVDTPADLHNYEMNFDALWKIMDEHYCFFTYKHTNWDSIGNVYRERLQTMQKVNDITFFKLCSDMLNELKDGHVNLTSSFDVSRYWAWFQDYPDNFNSQLLFSDRYLGKSYSIAGGFDYCILPNSKTGYVYYGDFSIGFSAMNLSWIIASMVQCNGMILDVRNNSGGVLTNAEAIAARFTTQPVKYGYIYHKTGPGHDDFSTPEAQWLQPYSTNADATNWVKKPVIVLTNRSCFSATNTFVSMMKTLPNVIVIGDKTGGGGGLPMSSELPNGWSVRYSACPMLDANMQNIEFGIDPDIEVNMTSTDMNKGFDTIIETAITYIKQYE